MDTPQWQQGIIGAVRPAAADQTPIRPVEKKPRPDQNANCPRCNSTNTKFCYYNNYSLSQPRFFCKTCRRYWTEGGTLRNVPVGGGSRRKHKPSKNTDLTPPTPTPTPTPTHDQNPKFAPIYNGIPQLVNLPFCPQQNSNFNSTHLSFTDLLKTTTTTTTANFTSGGGGTSVINHDNSGFNASSVFSSGLMHEIENNGFGAVQDHSRTGFAFEEPKPVELPLDSNGYWINGVLPNPGGSNW